MSDASRAAPKKAKKKASPARHGRLDYEPVEILLRVTNRSEAKRLKSCRKEPWTVAWIERHVRAGEVLIDVGANVGAYALVAAKACGATVYALEPSYPSYEALCENAVLNGIGDRLRPLALALGERTTVSHIGLRSLEPGAGIHTLADHPQRYLSYEAVYDQPVMVFTLDDLVAQLGVPVPQHVKIDVDGPELDVLRGASATLADRQLRTLLIEMEQGLESPIGELLGAAGFEVLERHERPPSDKFDPPVYALFGRSKASVLDSGAADPGSAAPPTADAPPTPPDARPPIS